MNYRTRLSATNDWLADHDQSHPLWAMFWEHANHLANLISQEANRGRTKA